MGKISPVFILLLPFMVFFSGSVMAESQGLSDPMEPLDYQLPAVPLGYDTPEITQESWTLSGILYSKQRSVAVIDGTPMQAGDTLEGYRLEQIFPDKVILQNSHHELILYRAGTGLKNRSARNR